MMHYSQSYSRHTVIMKGQAPHSIGNDRSLGYRQMEKETVHVNKYAYAYVYNYMCIYIYVRWGRSSSRLYKILNQVQRFVISNLGNREV